MTETRDAQGRSDSSLGALRSVFRSPNLRKLQLAWAGSNLGTWGYGIALGVYAFQQGGAAAVGLVALLRWIPAAIAAPFLGVLADRTSRKLVMIGSDVGRVIVIGLAAAAIFAGMHEAIVYTLAIIGAVLAAAFRPAQAAITPHLVETPEELAASNVVASSVESLGMFVGPAVGAAVLAVSGPGEVFLVAAATFAWSALLIAAIRADERPAEEEAGETGEPSPFRAQVTEGFRTILVERKARLLVLLFGAQTLVAGTLVVFEVVIPIEILGRDEAWVGIIAAAFGIGGIVGALMAGAMVGRSRMAADFGVGNLLWGVPLIVVGIWPHPAVAIAAMAGMGMGNTIVDVSGMTLLQRSVPDDVLARVFGVLETMWLLTIAIGAAVTPPLIEAIGDRASLIVVGCLLPVVVILRWRRLQAIDDETAVRRRERALLRGISFFRVLPAPVLEKLAGRLEPRRAAAGEVIFEQGDRGDRFYVIAEGRVEVRRGGEIVNVLGAGGAFGEIALLRDVPRQATVVALEDTELLGLEGADFVAAVTGHGPAREAATTAMKTYRRRPSLGG